MKTAPPRTDRSTESLLAEAADAFTDDLNAGRSPTIDEYAAKYPEIAPIIRQVFPALAVLDASRSSRSAGGESQSDFADLRRQRLGDFRIERELGRGGMGIVYEARELSLDRTVALKILPFASLLDEKQLARFKNEARAAATLSHPNIVPIYSVGSDRGVHYYAMQLIRGQSLAETIAALSRSALPKRTSGTNITYRESVVSGQSSVARSFPATDHGQLTTDNPGQSQIPNPKSQFDTVAAALSTEHSTNPKRYFRRVAEIGIQIAEALDHAHEQGVLHRDVKPANILLDHQGKAWITDFGLARIGPDAGLTLTGDVVGTLRYMSPEQVQGRTAVVDHRSDVYSLGVTLYELATLRPAFAGDDRPTLARRIAEEDSCPPRQLRPEIPPDLETIILKAIEKDPKDRFASTAEFAADLQRHLSHEPIRARRPSLASRAAKWSRRHQPFVWAALVTLTIVTTSLAAAAILTSRAYQSELAHRRRAERNADLARNAVSDIYEQVALSWLGDGQQLTAHQQDFLQKALAIQQQLLQQPATSREARRGQAETHFHVGAIHYHLGEYVQARQAFERSIALYKQLLADEPRVPGYKKALADAYNNLSLTQRAQLDLVQHEKSLALARGELEDLVRRFPEEPEYRHELAHNDLNRAGTLELLGRLGEAENFARQARTGYRAFMQVEPKLALWPLNFAKTSGLLSNILRKQQRYDEAQLVCREGMDECQRLVRAFPEDRSARVTSATLTADFGQILLDSGELAEAEKHLRAALDIWQPVILAYSREPVVPQHIDLSTKHILRLGDVLHRAGKVDDAEAQFRRGIELAEAFALDFPDVPAFQETAATGYQQLALLLKEYRPIDAPSAFEGAISIRRALARRFPTHADYLGQLGGTLNNWGNWLRDEKRYPEALDVYTEAIRHQRAAMNLAPGQARYRENLRNHHMNLTRTLIDLADHRAAAAAVEDMLREIPDTADHAAEILTQCAALGQDDRALSDSDGENLASQYQQRADRLKSTGHMQHNGLK